MSPIRVTNVRLDASLSDRRCDISVQNADWYGGAPPLRFDQLPADIQAALRKWVDA